MYILAVALSSQWPSPTPSPLPPFTPRSVLFLSVCSVPLGESPALWMQSYHNYHFIARLSQFKAVRSSPRGMTMTQRVVGNLPHLFSSFWAWDWAISLCIFRENMIPGAAVAASLCPWIKSSWCVGTALGVDHLLQPPWPHHRPEHGRDIRSAVCPSAFVTGFLSSLLLLFWVIVWPSSWTWSHSYSVNWAAGTSCVKPSGVERRGGESEKETGSERHEPVTDILRDWILMDQL